MGVDATFEIPAIKVPDLSQAECYLITDFGADQSDQFANSNAIKLAIDKGVLGLETDVLYQWGDLVPTYEPRLTPIKDINMTNVNSGDVEFVSRIMAEEEKPVENVQLKNIQVDEIRGEELIYKNVIKMNLME
ncbi:hypothetical protein QWY93_09155 [Echinicola jeungdonensis]|uniref:Uncharacterized protein n=1 Tax=Echinicola jeungdonensis TaxID=709343 RepID=A0ABV5J8A2_9BACT|nr:hypothetical protein [Echinicola jeungdonensis]MDN3669498.1 hypothetical protein [Echinicola jeungdonensis]